ncbi:hypothetical protein HMPREF9441_03672 [Paraprevotella clara YIT 11840]|uniref:Uncharacterized protein n=1 Tax=Paraprevotella clara YIT 11840 TaxID=762968 RepID=G5SWA1_9BACT|nr:hypothetical protein HMPREF9441_03672 [Paraprevotella clara YIT 11840]
MFCCIVLNRPSFSDIFLYAVAEKQPSGAFGSERHKRCFFSSVPVRYLPANFATVH